MYLDKLKPHLFNVCSTGGLKMKVLLLSLICAVALGCAGSVRPAPTRPDSFPLPPLDISSLPPPPLMEGIGNSRLEITTHSEVVRAYFNQGLNLLHGFWYFEAWRAFGEAARLDSSCAMAYWGIYQSLRGNNSNYRAKKRALGKAKALGAGASEHEQYYIRAIALLDSLGRKGHPAYLREMEGLIERYPDDVEARLFLVRFAMHHLGFYAGPRAGYPNRWEILRELLSSHPDHVGVHHYWVHAVEFGEHPETGLQSAQRLSRMAPNVGHIVHMPGHIYYRMGEYDKARQSFIASAQVDSAYMVDQRIPVNRTWNYVHNLNYLLANYAEDGRYQEGLEWARRLQQAPLDPKRSLFFYQGRMAPVHLQMRYGFWEEAAQSLEELAQNDTLSTAFVVDYISGLLAYAKGMAAVQKGQVDEAGRQAKALDELGWQLKMQEREGRDIYYSRKRAGTLIVAALDLKGTVYSLQGRHEEALELLQEGAEEEKKLGYSEPPRYPRPVLESLGEAHLRTGNWEGAREAFAAVLKKRPNSGHALLGAARSYALAGKEATAAEAYRVFLQSWRHADGDLPQVQQAREWLKAHGER